MNYFTLLRIGRKRKHKNIWILSKLMINGGMEHGMLVVNVTHVSVTLSGQADSVRNKNKYIQ